ncbi:Uncharacterized membrane-anchored protein YjiN, DUF445 family [Haloechinothrix alba]|uniref:Uncharacterized membrane-anchored protein YjiN, DUF445 family n=1 Tax=Haloechinothrix alba TaxID=664784 RepID=A0A238W278_9PSEU|nr:Uncharacterized membrane-anchored protein YjiN, DUF445 family [Haloechinothrix alba]
MVAVKQLTAGERVRPGAGAPATAPVPPQGASVADEVKRRDLNRMKAVSLAFLAGAAAVFLLASWAESRGWPGWVSYLRAAAEAGMIGGIADWFAITVLFRHPLGLKIPHTAIIPKRKDQFGASLGEFIDRNFLSEEVVHDKLRRMEVARTIGEWLAQEANAQRVTAELASVTRGAVTVLRDADVQAMLERAVTARAVDTPWAPALGRVLEQVCVDGAHHQLVDLVCDRAYEWVRDNHATVLRVVSERAPSWSPRFVDDLVADKVYGEVLSFAWAVKVDVNHPMRMAVDTFLTEFARDLRDDPETMARAEEIKRRVVEHPEVGKLIGSAWSTAKEMLLNAAEDPSSELRSRVRDGIRGFGIRMSSDEALRDKVDGWVEGAASYLVTNYSTQITSLITDTVERWDAADTSRRIELQVGRDLQFIRINGTLVGALVGIVIHAVSQLLF